MKYELIKNDPEILTYIKEADASLASLKFTEHSVQHAALVADRAGMILENLGFSEKEVDLAHIAGFLHDIGNLVNRIEHSQSGAVLAFHFLEKRGFAPEEIAPIVAAIGNHDEGTGTPVNALAAALILADKSDVRRSRVRNATTEKLDIHDRVNHSVTKSELKINREKTMIKLKLSVDTKVSSVMEYFEIFMERMILCKKAAEKLNLEFKLFINEQQLI